MNYLPKEKCETINRFNNIIDSQRTLIAEILVRVIICNKTGLKNKDIIFLKNEYGKPFIGNLNGFHFNLPHSYDWVVCVTHNQSVGIDIEKIKLIDFDIARRFFTEDEYQDMLSKSTFERLYYFYDLWTLKESYIKAIGKGLYIPLNSFSFKINNSILLKTKNEFGKYYFRQ